MMMLIFSPQPVRSRFLASDTSSPMAGTTVVADAGFT
jgi:hypothetical protein